MTPENTSQQSTGTSKIHIDTGVDQTNVECYIFHKRYDKYCGRQYSTVVGLLEIVLYFVFVSYYCVTPPMSEHLY